MQSASIRFAVIATTLFWMTACGRPETDVQQRPPSNVIIILVDTLRADHMSTYGYERQTTPFIDRWAENAIVFERARSQASCTFPSVNSLLTSRYSGVFTAQKKGDLGIPEEIPGVAEILRAHGFRTMAFSASPIVRATPSTYNPVGGFDRGFDTFDETCLWRHGKCLNRRFAKALAGLEEPFFAYIHYMDPHAHYKPPKKFRMKFSRPYDGFDFISKGNPNPIGKMLYAGGPKYDVSDRDIEHLADLYDEEIGYFDHVFKRLTEELEARGLLDRTMIVFSSDHGEEFLEHGHIKHCRGVWDTVTRVPLMFQIPGLERGRLIEAPVGNIDIVPTVLDYLGIEADEYGFEGSSLRPLIEGESADRKFAFSENGRYRSVDDGRFHLILDASQDRLTLFDVRNDPFEQSDLFDPSHADLARLADGLGHWLEETGQRVRIEDSVAAAQSKEEELRALGYLE